MSQHGCHNQTNPPRRDFIGSRRNQRNQQTHAKSHLHSEDHCDRNDPRHGPHRLDRASGACAGPAPSQTPAPGETIVITGSNIARSDYEGPQSTIIYDSQKIERMGARTVTEVLQKLPQNTAGFTDAGE
jgi:hypothetical protein